MTLSVPRYLSDDEINEIVDVIPEVTAGTRDISKKIREEIMKISRLQLRDYKLSPDAIGELKDEIIRQFKKSVINAGETIGMAAAAAIGAPMTQLNLDTFHHTGSGKAVGIDAFKELFNATEMKKHTNTITHFINKNLSVEEVLEYRRSLIGVSIGDLCISHQIIEYDKFKENKNWWYSYYEKITGVEFKKSEYFLRLKFNVDKLYKFKVTLNDIVNKLETNSGTYEIVKCIASPISEGLIDVYPNSGVLSECLKLDTNINGSLLDKNLKKICDIDSECDGVSGKEALLFLTVVLVPNLKFLIIKGIIGIKNLYPITIKTTTMFLSEENVITNNKNEFLIWLNIVKILTTGFSIEKIINFLENADISIIEKDERYLHVKMPKGWKDFIDEENPTVFDFLDYKIKKEEEEIKLWTFKEKKKGVIYPIYNYSDFWKNSTYVYAELVGSNLKTLLGKEIIDSTRTYSNNPHEILATFDIEACRNFLALNFYTMLIDSNSYINPKYIYLLPDFMTNTGIVIPITSKGISKHGRGAFADASFQEPLTHFVKAAISGKTESASSVSSSIFMGKRINIGTGLSKFTLREDVLDSLQKIDIKEYEKFGFVPPDFYENEDKGNEKIVKDTMVYDEDDLFKEEVRVALKVNKNKLSKMVKNIDDTAGTKGPIPFPDSIIQEIPDILKKLVSFDSDDDLPNLGNLTYDKILKNITKEVAEIKNKEFPVKFVDLKKYMDNINKYI